MNLFMTCRGQRDDIKLGCVVRIVDDSILLQTESGPNDHRKDAPLFIVGS